MSRWHILKEEPPLNRWKRNNSLWLYNAEEAKEAVHGAYVNFGEEAAKLEREEYSDDAGNRIQVTHWAEARDSETGPPPLPKSSLSLNRQPERGGGNEKPQREQKPESP